jgi:hypothetical protein
VLEWGQTLGELRAEGLQRDDGQPGHHREDGANNSNAKAGWGGFGQKEKILNRCQQE